MSLFLQMLYQLFFSPLELLFELVFDISNAILANPGAAIIPLSLTVNFLLLPLYNRAETIQTEEREREKRMAPSVAHIKKTFSGDERFMMLQTYYKQNNYKPIYALRSSLAILLELPFFIAAYHFLSHYTLFAGASFGILKNLKEPDQLIHLGSVSINLLPILMTAINIVSSMIYAKGFSRKEKIQLYGMALIFLVLLYNSPSALVFYWTLNNLFSLCKNIVMKTGKAKEILMLIFLAMSLGIMVYSFLLFDGGEKYRMIPPVLALFLLFTAVGLYYSDKKTKTIGKKDTETTSEEKRKKEEEKRASTKIFVWSCVFLAVLTGLLIPSALINSSPSEFIIVSDVHSPVRYILSSLMCATGTFVIWFGLFYYLSGDAVKKWASRVFFVVSITGIVNYIFFGKNLGYLNPNLTYSYHEILDKDITINCLFTVLAILLLLLLWQKQKKIILFALPVFVAAVSVIALYNVVGISREMVQIRRLFSADHEGRAEFTLSKEGKNVIVIMLDRSINSYIPYIFNEKPEIKEQFEGFTWYPNTLSFGMTTNIGTPTLFGGYEYMPSEINSRTDTTLEDEQNAALRVMPVLFDEAGYEVTVCDPPYAGYTYVPDLTIYSDHPDISTYNTQRGQFYSDPKLGEVQDETWTRNLFCFSIMKIAPLFMQDMIYENGMYHDPSALANNGYMSQYLIDDNRSFGEDLDFLYSYSVLQALPEITNISEGAENTFLMMENSTTHNVAVLQEPEYEPAMRVDNSAYESENHDRFTLDDRSMVVETGWQYAHYDCNVAALREVGEWLDYLREMGVYDNTRIIIVSDHGFALKNHPEWFMQNNVDLSKYAWNCNDIMAYNPLLMVKDFGSTEFTTDYTFMTNADTPLLAMNGLIENPVNPATGNPITDEAKYADTLYVMFTDDWRTNVNNGNRFSVGQWYAFKNQYIFDPANWEDDGER